MPIRILAVRTPPLPGFSSNMVCTIGRAVIQDDALIDQRPWHRRNDMPDGLSLVQRGGDDRSLRRVHAMRCLGVNESCVSSPNHPLKNTRDQYCRAKDAVRAILRLCGSCAERSGREVEQPKRVRKDRQIRKHHTKRDQPRDIPRIVRREGEHHRERQKERAGKQHGALR